MFLQFQKFLFEFVYVYVGLGLGLGLIGVRSTFIKHKFIKEISFEIIYKIKSHNY